jgi:hypothetical protein
VLPSVEKFPSASVAAQISEPGYAKADDINLVAPAACISRLDQYRQLPAEVARPVIEVHRHDMNDIAICHCDRGFLIGADALNSALSFTVRYRGLGNAITSISVKRSAFRR